MLLLAHFEGKIFVSVGRNFNCYLVTAAAYSVGTRGFPLGAKWPGYESDHPFAFSAEFKNGSSCTTIFPYVFFVWCLIGHSDSFTSLPVL